jgi:soluble lytic murein transglycosylase-like protein
MECWQNIPAELAWRMGSLATSVVIIGLLLSPIDSARAAGDHSAPHVTRSSVRAHSWGFAQNTAPGPTDPNATVAEGANSAAPRPDVVCQTLQSAAQENDLPPEFLTRLIWQESRFDARAVSRKGAQGIAQFMPGTAAWVKLGDPFDSAAAIAKSAELLRTLRTQFGNLGLAAAAYNAGAKRVRDWLTGRRILPDETQAYVRVVWSRRRRMEGGPIGPIEREFT